MKKFFAVFSILLLTLALASCFYDRIYDYYDDSPTHRPDENGIYYSALDIDLIAYSIADEEDESKTVTNYELQIGLRDNINGQAVLSHEEVDALIDAINKKIGVEFSYIDSIPGYDFTKFCFSLEQMPDMTREADRKFGFFTILRNFKFAAPEWMESLWADARVAVDDLLSGIDNRALRIDGDAIRSRFYFAVSESFDSKNAVRENRQLRGLLGAQDGSNASCLVWDMQSTTISDIEITYKAMANGWFIVPIILGTVAVIILFAASKHKRNEKSEEVSLNENVQKPDDDALGRQVTIEEILNPKQREDEDAHK